MAGSIDVIRNLQAMANRERAAIHALGQQFAAKGEAYAKKNARWKDRTGNARQGLFGYVLEDGNDMKVRTAHTMDYGVYLEYANSGKYAILEETAAKHAPEFFEAVRKLVSGQ
jgi:hypothetical protein